MNVRDRVITNVDILESNYNGVQFQVTKRMSDRWQMLAGLSLQKHEGFAHGGTFTNPGAQSDLNNPNYRQNRGQRLGLHRSAVDGLARGHLRAAVRGGGVGEIHRAQRRSARASAQRDGPQSGR